MRIAPGRSLLVLVVTGGLCATTFASAAGLGLTSHTLFATTAPAQCDPDGVTTTRTVSGGIVETVTVEGIHAACIGADFAVTLADGSAAQLAERRLCDVPSGGFGGSGNALTLGFDFSSAAILDADAPGTHVAIFRDGVTAVSPPACS
jgi:hypothetical protein